MLKSSNNVGIGELNIRKFPVTGMQTTHAIDRYSTGSTASATAMVTGYKTTINTISMDPNHSKDYKTISEMAKGTPLINAVKIIQVKIWHPSL